MMVATLAANSQILSLRVPPIRPRWRSPARCCPLCSCGYGIVMNPIGPRMLVKDSQFLHVSSNTYRNPAVHNRIVHLPHTSTSRALRALFRRYRPSCSCPVLTHLRDSETVPKGAKTTTVQTFSEKIDTSWYKSKIVKGSSFHHLPCFMVWGCTLLTFTTDDSATTASQKQKIG